MAVPIYPLSSVVPRKSSVKPQQNATPDRTDGGGIRVASLAVIDAYDISIEHPFVTQTMVDALLSFYGDYKDQTVALIRPDSMVYYAPLLDPPAVEEVSRTHFNAKVSLTGRRIQSYTPADYGSFEATALPTVTIVTGAATPTKSTANTPPFGLASLLITKNTTDGVATLIALAANATTYNVTVPANRKWLMIQSIYQTGTVRAIDCQLRTSDAATTSGATTYTPAAIGTWYRFARVVDLSAKSQTTLQLRYSLASAMASGNTCHLDGIVMLDITDIATYLTESAYPSAYIPPEP